jgi:hydroxymethylbilane synthase
VPEYERWRIFSQVVAPDGDTMIQIDMEFPLTSDAESLGRAVADDLKSRGALDLLSLSTI